jgi:hypothetical protein
MYLRGVDCELDGLERGVQLAAVCAVADNLCGKICRSTVSNWSFISKAPKYSATKRMFAQSFAAQQFKPSLNWCICHFMPLLAY